MSQVPPHAVTLSRRCLAPGCGAQLNGRSHKRTCSPRCRTALWRARKALESDTARRAIDMGLSPADLWRTAPADFERWDREFGFGLDAAASAVDALCPAYITPEQDSFMTPWGPRCAVNRWGLRVAFLNPPYSGRGRHPRAAGLLAWMARAVDQARAWSMWVVVLVPASMNTRYMQTAHREGIEIRLCRSRLAFVNPDTGRPTSGNRHDSCLCIISPQRSPEGAARVTYEGAAPQLSRSPAAAGNGRNVPTVFQRIGAAGYSDRRTPTLETDCTPSRIQPIVHGGG